MNLVSTLILLIAQYKLISATTISGSNSLVVSSTESSKEGITKIQNENPNIEPNPKISSMHIQTNISNRFATTLVTSKVKNNKNTAAETTFSVILPENAFVSEFVMEIDGKSYKAYVKEKEEAKKIYEEAVSRGQSAGHVELNARDSKTFTVSVNVEPESKTTFLLKYEELLQRQVGKYELVVNIHPGQIVEDLQVQVNINESRQLQFVRTPSLRTGNEISKNEENLNPSANINIINPTSAVVVFTPDKDQQRKFGKLLGGQKEAGLSGQFVVQYDVERDPQGGEVLVRDGYFVHFFSPSNLKPLQKHVVFVLDHSGSMFGRKIEQLTEAMKNILSQLKPNDLFNILRFSNKALVWNTVENKFSEVNTPGNYGQLEPHLRELGLPKGVEATKENIEKAQNVTSDHANLGMTNIIAGLEVGLFLIKKTQEEFPSKYQPMIIFLTDGYANVGVGDGNEITKIVTKLNSGNNRASIISLSFGESSDKDFLRKLSSENLGFSRHIFEAADASLQIEEFYKTISSPLLSNVNFKYVDGVSDVTNTHYPLLFGGSELVVAGKTGEGSNISLPVYAVCEMGPIEFRPVQERPVSSLERLWAYLTVKELLKQREKTTNATELTQKALHLALKYSFVTPVTSLVVVKPNKSESVDSKNTVPTALPDSSHALAMKGSMSRTTPFYGARSAVSLGSPGIPGRRYFMRGPPGFSGHSLVPAPRPFPHSIISGPSPAQLTTTTRPLFTSQKPKNTNAPAWLVELKNKNDTITTPTGTFELGDSGVVTIQPNCTNAPSNGAGHCTILFDCPQIFHILTDLSVYLQYFCPLNDRYAGVCCPNSSGLTP